MSNVHIFRAKDQLATKYWVDLSSWESGKFKRDGFWVRCRRRALRYCHKCKKKRWAANLFIHVYYDMTLHFCKPGKGCKA